MGEMKPSQLGVVESDSPLPACSFFGIVEQFVYHSDSPLEHAESCPTLAKVRNLNNDLRELQDGGEIALNQTYA